MRWEQAIVGAIALVAAVVVTGIVPRRATAVSAATRVHDKRALLRYLGSFFQYQ